MNAHVKKSLAVAGIVSGVGLAVVTGTGMVSAASSNTATDPQSSLVDKLVSKFHLNKSDVQAVFDEDRASHEAQHQQKIEDRLNQAVTDKKITSEQKDKILAKLKEMKADMDANRDSMKDKTPAERKAAMDAKRTELEKWANDNGIPLKYLQMGGPGGGHHMGMRGGMGEMGHRGPGGADNDGDADDATSSGTSSTTTN